MNINNLIVTQNELRSMHNLQMMLNSFNESLYPLSTDKIILIKTEDDKHYIHNGHHRLVALYLLGIEELSPEWYTIWNMTYAQLTSINFDKGYVTPYDPRRECRKSNFMQYKTKAMNIFHIYGYVGAINFVNLALASQVYLEKRQINTVKELAKYAELLGITSANT